MTKELKKTYIFNPGERIDIGTVDSLRSDIEKVLESKDVEEIYIEMKFVQVCDLYGITFLSEAFNLIRNAGLDCSMSKPQPLIEKMLIKSGFTEFREKLNED